MERAVMLYGLPPGFTTQDLHGLLRRFGSVHHVRLSPYNQSAFVLGYGEMNCAQQAQQVAQALHGTVVRGHQLIVHRSTLLYVPQAKTTVRTDHIAVSLAYGSP